MKSNIFCTVIFLLSGSVSAQEDQIILKDKSSEYWNFSVSMGLTGHVYSKDLIETNTPGLSYNIDISLTPKRNVGFFLNYGSATLNGRYYDYYNLFPSRFGKIDFSQFTLGPRFFSNSKNSFLDVGLGHFRINTEEEVGMTLGLGGKIKISDKYAVCLAGRFNAADVFNKPYTYYSVSFGFEFNDRKENLKIAKTNNRFSVAALAGTFGESFGGSGNAAFSAELTYDVGKQTALVINYIYSNSQFSYSNDLGYLVDVYKTWQNELTGGVRLYMRGSNLRLFIEGMTGVYNVATEYGDDPNYYVYPVSYANNYFGFTFGGGVEFSIIDNLAGLVKTDFSSHIKEGSYLGLFGGLKYRL